MKAQFALTESLVAVLIIFLASLAISYSVYSVSLHHTDAEYSNLFYDLIEAAYHNQTFNACLTYANGSCHGILQQLSRVYGIQYIRISEGASETNYGSPAGCTQKYLRCAMMGNGTPTSLSCVYMCGV